MGQGRGTRWQGAYSVVCSQYVSKERMSSEHPGLGAKSDPRVIILEVHLVWRPLTDFNLDNVSVFEHTSRTYDWASTDIDLLAPGGPCVPRG